MRLRPRVQDMGRRAERSGTVLVEAELYIASKGAAEALGIQTIAGEFGDEARIKPKVGSSAATGVALRRGLGRVRHLQAQERCLCNFGYSMGLMKTHGTDDVPDTLTKHVGRELLERHMPALGFEFVPEGTD